MRRLAALAVALLILPMPARAQAVDEIADELAFRHYYLEEGVDASVNEVEQLVADHPGVNFVALANEVDRGADSLAADLLEAIGEGTVIVLTPGEVGAVSFDHDDAAMEAALDAVVSIPTASYLDAFEAFATSLAGGDGSAVAGSSGFPWIPVLVLGIPIVLIAFAMWRSGRHRKDAASERLQQARQEIRQQMDVIAGQIVALADDPRVEQYADALNHYRAASETFQQAESRLITSVTDAALEDLSDDLDRARWELEATEAIVEGRAPPQEPVDEKPQPCFFDPTHGAGVEEAELQTPAGPRKVMVCRADAEKLRKGEAPQPRQIPMGSQQYPAPQVPRSNGGLGLDWLDVFSILVGGMGQGMPYDWRPRPARNTGRVGLPFPRNRSMSGGSRSRNTMSRGRRQR
jgi:exonuclease VII small subunit